MHQNQALLPPGANVQVGRYARRTAICRCPPPQLADLAATRERFKKSGMMPTAAPRVQAERTILLRSMPQWREFVGVPGSS